MQATSDIGRVGQIVSGITLGASYGDAFLAAVAAGRAERSDIARWNQPVRQVGQDDWSVYEKPHALFQQLYLDTRNIAHAVSAG